MESINDIVIEQKKMKEDIKELKEKLLALVTKLEEVDSPVILPVPSTTPTDQIQSKRGVLW